jgi:peptide/nickel transport system substrate-binding protein
LIAAASLPMIVRGADGTRQPPMGNQAMKRRTLLAAAAATLAAPAVQARVSSVLRFIPQTDLTALDPVWTTATVSRNHGFLVFDTLYGLDEGYAAWPQMVAGHTVENDGRLWRLTLREGLYFHDGQAVRARDCVASVRRWAARDFFGLALIQATDELSAPDDRTIVFRLKKRFPLLPQALAKPASSMCPIMPERLATTDPFTAVTEMVGSGPYRFVNAERISGARVVYEKNPKYLPAPGRASFTAGAKVPIIERIEWNVIPDAATAAAALLADEADWWEQPTVDQLPMLEKGGITVRIDDPASNIGCLRFNHLYPPFDNPAIRRAVLGAIDQSDCMSAAAGTDRTYWKDHTGVFGSASPMATEAGIEVLTSPRDYARVKRDLAAAGYKGEKVVTLIATDQAITSQMSQVAADELRQAGMNIDLQMTDWGTVIQRRASREPIDKGGWNIFFTFLEGTNIFNPAGHLGIRGNGGKAWFGWPTAPKMEELRDAWFDAPDLAAQKEICRQLQVQFWQDVPYVPLGEYFRPTARRSNINVPTRGFPLFFNVTKS